MQRKVVRRRPTFSPAFPRSCQNRVSGLHGLECLREQSYLWMVKHGQTVKSCQIMSKLAWGDRLTIDVDKAVF